MRDRPSKSKLARHGLLPPLGQTHSTAHNMNSAGNDAEGARGSHQRTESHNGPETAKLLQSNRSDEGRYAVADASLPGKNSQLTADAIVSERIDKEGGELPHTE
jgi:hypothetical protein